MAKSAIIIETPSCCGECRLMVPGVEVDWCPASVGTGVIEDRKSRPDWCPAHDLPENKAPLTDEELEEANFEL